MSLRFVRDTVYLPDHHAVKTTALDGNNVVPCVTTRSALMLLGCGHRDDPGRMVEKFEHHRPMIESAAAFKHRNGQHWQSGAVIIDEGDLCALFGFSGV
ncbi:DUF1488 family protein [Dongia sedimenti]|uniref:DUF1488 family protein n=1 Tax=Dongia sedimenti TaxID=3064282 RepID=A0ABU0YLU8_9PROT|nr:DUF1488 family protein [Rhodospirillaceae bacterium R-7]